MRELSANTISAYVIAVLFGSIGCVLVARMTRAIVRRVTARPKWPRVAFWATWSVLTMWLVWALFVPSVRFEVVSVSPDGRTRLRLQDITSGMLYNDLGWRMRARLEDTRSSRCLAAVTISDWNSSFDDLDPVMPTPEDVSIRWGEDGRSVRVQLGSSVWRLPQGTRTDETSISP